ncbi:erythromycin esterase family protein [Glycomyces tenuis]|uniref:erythromycin esterase family protein n=1 Tax=Glycomyces tenuis TaxID=58116 RepID=UPI0009DC2299|nr:erythromycin esterase family protein [Glycomyces tenuis]
MSRLIGFAEWVGGHGSPMASYKLDDDLDELEPLRAIVGDARVVALGESSHHVSEFYRVRHRMMRYLVERCGFTVYALEAPFTQGQRLEQWVAGGSEPVEEVAATSIAANLGDCAEMHEALRWIRDRNTAGTALRCVGTDLPGAAGSPLPALQAAESHVRAAEALALLRRASAIAERFAVPSMLKSMAGYAALETAEQNALTAALSGLLARMERADSYQRRSDSGEGEGEGYATVLHHLRGAWLVDQLHRSNLTDGFESASTFRDQYIADSVQRLLETSPPGTRVILAAHNWHIKKTPNPQDSAPPLLTAGYHLAASLGDDYRAIGITHSGGRTATAGPHPDDPADFAFIDAPLPEPAANSIEAAFPTEPAWTLADLRSAEGAIDDAASFQATRMSDYFLDEPVFQAFDAIANVSRTTTTDFALQAARH